MKTLGVQAAVIILPTIGEHLHIPASRQQWIVSAYNLTFGCFLVCPSSLSRPYTDIRGVVALGTTSRCIRQTTHLPVRLGVDDDHEYPGTVHAE